MIVRYCISLPEPFDVPCCSLDGQYLRQPQLHLESQLANTLDWTAELSVEVASSTRPNRTVKDLRLPGSVSGRPYWLSRKSAVSVGEIFTQPGMCIMRPFPRTCTARPPRSSSRPCSIHLSEESWQITYIDVRRLLRIVIAVSTLQEIKLNYACLRCQCHSEVGLLQ